MFGYLNLNDPRDIANNEAQEANNCRVDSGKLVYATWSVDETRNRRFTRTINLSLHTYRINDSGYAPAEIVRDGYGKIGDQLGLDPPTLSAPFSVGVTTSSGNPYPPGSYQYAITIDDALWGEESAPTIVSVNVGTNQVARFQNFPALTSAPYDKKNCSFRLYRRPLGGTEFLFVASIPSGTSSYTDSMPDVSLGEPCETENNVRYCSPSSAGNAGHIIFFKDKLFSAFGWSNGSKLHFSKTGEPGFTERGFFFDLPEAIVDLVPKDEVLFIFTLKRVMILYGNDESDFVLKETGCVCGTSQAAAGLVADQLLFGEEKDREIFINGASAGNAPLIDSIQAISGNASVNISDKIKPIFPLCLTTSTGDDDDLRFMTGVLNNRFWVLRYAKLTKYSFATEAEFLAECGQAKYLIYDYGQGFLTSDGGSTFQYRTKEFGELGRLSQFRVGYVVAEGEFDLEIYGDNRLLTTHHFNLPEKTRKRFTVKPYRCNTFSFRFIGQQNAVIYEYGRLE